MSTLKELIEQHKDALAAYGDDYEQIAALLNAPTVVANPAAGEKTETTTPTPITLKMLLALVPAAEAVKIYGMGTFVDDLKTAIDAGDREYMAYLLSVAAAANAISAPTIAALTALLQATTTTETTQPDTIPGPSLASAAGLGRVSSADVQAALN